MNSFEIGTRYESYQELMHDLNKFCVETKSKFWKRDARTIRAARPGLFPKPIKASLIYHEVKFICIYGGIQTKSKAIVRHRPQRQKTGCPAYLRFRVSNDGYYLVLVAMNLKHNHDLKESLRKNKADKRRISDDVEEQVRKMFKGNDKYKAVLKEEESDDDIAVEYIEVHIDDEQETPVNFTFRGFMAPTLTAFHDDAKKTVNLDIIPAYAKFIKDSGITGILVNGTSGEGPSLSVNERKSVTEAWLKAARSTGLHLMIQVGGAPLPDVIELAQHAEKIGVDSLLCLPELYFKPTTVDDLIRYLKPVGEAAPNTPLLYYHIPAFTNVTVNMGQFLEAVDGKIPNFVGIKYTNNDVPLGLEAIKARGGKFAVFLGCDQVMAGAFTLGFDSVIATTLNMYPQYSIDILKYIQENKVEEARAKQRQLNNIIEAITRNGSWVATMKEAMNLVSPINCGPIREPLKALTDSQVKQMAEEIKALKL